MSPFSARWPGGHDGESWKRACREKTEWLIARSIDPADFATWNPIARRSEVAHGIARETTRLLVAAAEKAERARVDRAGL